MRFPRKRRHRVGAFGRSGFERSAQASAAVPANRTLLIAVDRVNERSPACNSTFQLASILAKLRFSHASHCSAP